MPYRKIFLTKPFLRLVVAWLLITAATFSVCAACPKEGGTFQGGGDSVPHYRR
jgi:hypothetical protein